MLKGLQHIWCDEALRVRLFALLDEHILPEADRTVGRPGMDLWQILVLGVLKQGLGCDFGVFRRICGQNGGLVVPRQTHSVPMLAAVKARCSVAPRCVGLTAWTPAPRTRVPASCGSP